MQAAVEAQLGTSDHCLVTTKIDTTPPPSITALPRRVSQFEKRDHEGLKGFFAGFPWDLHVFKHVPGNVDVAVKNFTDTVCYGMEKFISIPF
jgi:hypothetical protein